MITCETEAGLSAEQCAEFHEEGFLGPFTLCSPEEMAAVAEECNSLCDEGMPGAQHNRHLDNAVVRGFTEHPAVINKAASLLGDVMIWRTNFFRKLPGGKEIPWHQDWNYWPLEAAVVFSAWLAIDDVTIDNSAPQFIPGTHKLQVPHVQAPPEMQFGEMADPAHVDTKKAVDMVMKAGQFVIFNERTLHHSFANSSDKRRLGLALRYISPITRVTDYDENGPQPHVLRLLHGTDRMGFNRLAD